jgi:hypothetical protein
MLYERMTGDARYREFAVKQRDWLLGRNPWGTTMFTGVGSVFPKDTHMMTFRLTGRIARGGLVDGPVYERIFKSLKGVAITEPDPLAAFQGPAVYHDDQRTNDGWDGVGDSNVRPVRERLWRKLTASIKAQPIGS